MPDTSSAWQAGELQLHRSGSLIIQVPNALARGYFASINEPGASLPGSKEEPFYAHIDVMLPAEVAKVGANNITERGKSFKYRLGILQAVDFSKGCPVKELQPFSKVWWLPVTAPDLIKLRNSYGLGPLILPLHCTVGVRRRGVIVTGTTTKVAWDHVGRAALMKYREKQAASRPPTTYQQMLRNAIKLTKAPKSQAQADAGNYQKGHITCNGMQISIETPAGKSRKPEWPALKNHYGYVTRVYDPKSKQHVAVGEAADGDHVDVFLNDATSDYAYVVDQVNPKTGKFDEHKVMLGFDTLDAAKSAYKANYSADWKGLGKITRLTMHQFRQWLVDGDKKSPMAEQAFTLKEADGKEDDEEDQPVVVMIQRTMGIKIIAPKDEDEDEQRESLKELVESWMKEEQDS